MVLAAGLGVAIATHAQGSTQSWVPQVDPTSATAVPTAISCSSGAQCVIATSDGSYLDTPNHGTSWSVAPTQGSTGPTITGAVTCTVSFCLALSSAGVVSTLTTSDGSVSGVSSGPLLSSSSPLSFTGVSCTASGSFCLALANSGEGSGGVATYAEQTWSRVQRQGTSATGWEPQPTWQHVTFHGGPLNPQCVANGVCEAASMYGVWRTTDGGRTWVEQKSLNVDSPSPLSCPTVDDCVLSDFDDTGTPQLLITKDGGEKWTTVAVPDATLGGVVACPTVRRCYVSSGGDIYTSTTFGTTWSHMTAPSGATIRDIACATNSRCWAVGYDNVHRAQRGLIWSLS